MFKRLSSLEHLRAALRQRMYPVEFRIAEAVWPKDVAERVSQILQRRTPRTVAKGLVEEQIIAIGTRLWQVRNELDMRAGRPIDDALNRAGGRLESLWELLAKSGVDIYDHTGQIMPKGILPHLKIIAFQPTSSVTRDRIIETVKPTICFNGNVIQKGEVIVGTPEARK